MNTVAWEAAITFLAIAGIVWIGTYVVNNLIGLTTFLVGFFVLPVESEHLDRINDILSR